MNRGFWDIFLRVMPLTGVPFALMTYVLLDLQSRDGLGLLIAVLLGVGCGVVFGAGIGLYTRGMLLEFAIDPTLDIITRLQLLLVEMGYHEEHHLQKVVVFKPSFRSGIFADRIRVELLPELVRLEGPALHVEKIARNLGV